MSANDTEKILFLSDYMEGAHPSILKRLADTNLEKTAGYGTDDYCEEARNKIRLECGCPAAAVHFLVGGTQANATVIDALLRLYQGVISADTGHINGHEAGAIEASGHKVLALPHLFGKLEAQKIKSYMDDFYNDDNHSHMVMPGMVYISQPTEYGTLYSLSELKAISEVCRQRHIPLYMDGARLAYALACPENDVTLKDIASLCDVFYIGGTKCGALFGEAVVLPQPSIIPEFFTIVKQHGALLAKGRILGLQFDALFTDNLYYQLGKNAIETADRLRKGLQTLNMTLYFPTPTNQIFVVMENEQMKKLSSCAGFGFWEKYDDKRTVVRFVTSWATTPEDVDTLLDSLSRHI
ncbi:MAG: low specificity L-threonine aldolase [Treponemataceae bacterium]|nr:low specificity L-threonine aldolase [Treponemataceae bacterium]